MIPSPLFLRTRRARGGQSLVEFAMIALVLYLLLAAIIEFGRMLHGAQVVQAAADFAARELSRTPLPAAARFEDVVQPGPTAPAAAVYSEDFLAIDVRPWLADPQGQSLLEYLRSDRFESANGRRLPRVNEQLVPMMFLSHVGVSIDGRPWLLRFPGAIVTSSTAPSGYTIKVPLIAGRDASGVETIQWVEVLEDLQAGDEQSTPGDPADPFHIASQERGVVALRINYPFQAATMSGYRRNALGPFEPNISFPNQANDAAVNAPSTTGTPVAPNPEGTAGYGGAYGGTYGLGEHGAMNSPQLAAGFPLRPFRRVISAQAIYRREVFH
jgi:hypothetical protein